MTPIERLVRWIFERPHKCVECGAPVARDVVACSDECAAEYASSTAY